MKNILVRIPSFSKGNIGDSALICTLKKCFKDSNLTLPSSEREMNSVDLSKIDFLIYFGNDCIAYYSISTNIINKMLQNNKKVITNNVIKDHLTELIGLWMMVVN